MLVVLFCFGTNAVRQTGFYRVYDPMQFYAECLVRATVGLRKYEVFLYDIIHPRLYSNLHGIKYSLEKTKEWAVERKCVVPTFSE